MKSHMTHKMLLLLYSVRNMTDISGYHLLQMLPKTTVTVLLWLWLLLSLLLLLRV